MSYESFRAEFSSSLSNILGDHNQIQAVLLALDTVSTGYDFKRKVTDLIVHDGLPDEVRLYLASKSVENLKKGSLNNYYSALKRFFSRVTKPVNQVTSNDVRLYLHWYKETYNIKNSTLETIRIVLNSFYEWCVDEEIVNKSPLRHVQAIRVEDPERLPLSALELETVRQNCQTLREKALVDFLYSTACRVGELCALDIKNIDFSEHTVRIEHGKGDKGRTTYLNPEAEVSLKAYLASRHDDCPALFVPIRGRARHLEKRAVEVEIDKICSRCGLSIRVTPHVFRHTAASLALQRGMQIEQVQRFLGHARIQTTLRYAKVLDLDVKINHRKFVS